MKVELVIFMLGLLYISTVVDARRLSDESDNSPMSPRFDRVRRSRSGSDKSKKSHSGSQSGKSSKGSKKSPSRSSSSRSGSSSSRSGSSSSRSGSKKSSSGSPGTKTGKKTPTPPPPPPPSPTTTTTTTTTTARPRTTTTAKTTAATTTTTTTTEVPTTTTTVASTTSTTTTTDATNTADCSNTEDHAEGEMYAVGEGCYSTYCWKVHGVGMEMNCAPGTVYNPDLGICDWYNDVPACLEADVTDCTDPSGDPLDGVQFTKSEDCADGTYYKCNSGSIETSVCVNAPGRATAYVFNPMLRTCTEEEDGSICQTFSTDYVPTNDRKKRDIHEEK